MSRQRSITLGVGLILTLLMLAQPASAQDADGDGMPDSHENTYGCLMANTADGGVDYDADGLNRACNGTR